MRRTTFPFALALALVLGCVSCKVNAQKSGESNTHPDTENESLINDSENAKMPTQIEIEAAKATVEKLMRNFILEKDDFTWERKYTHKTSYNIFRKLARMIYYNTTIPSLATIQADITQYTSTSQPYLICSSIYFSRKGIFLNELLVKINETIVDVHKNVDNHYASQNDGISISEYFIFRDPNILYFIAANPNNEVKVRFNGDRGYFDFILDKTQQKAICETVELYDAMMLLRRAGIDIQTDIKAKPAKVP